MNSIIRKPRLIGIVSGMAVIAMIVLMLSLLPGCSSTGKLYPNGADQDFVNNWYKVLYAEAMTVDATMMTLGAMYRAGKFSEADKDRAVAAHTQFQLAFDEAVAKLILYYNSPTELTKAQANNACINVQIQTAVVTAISILTGGN